MSKSPTQVRAGLGCAPQGTPHTQPSTTPPSWPQGMVPTGLPVSRCPGWMLRTPPFQPSEMGWINLFPSPRVGVAGGAAELEPGEVWVQVPSGLGTPQPRGGLPLTFRAGVPEGGTGLSRRAWPCPRPRPPPGLVGGRLQLLAVGPRQPRPGQAALVARRGTRLPAKRPHPAPAPGAAAPSHPARQGRWGLWGSRAGPAVPPTPPRGGPEQEAVGGPGRARWHARVHAGGIPN